MEDRRIQKSKDAIQNCFLKLLTEKSVNRITVAEICRMANIGRGTFYLHYADVYALFNETEDRLYNGLYQMFENCFPTTNSENSRKLAKELVGYVEANREMFLLLTRMDNCHSLQKLRTVFREKVILENQCVYPDGNITYDTIEAIFVVSGIFGVMEEWLNDEMTAPKEYVAESINRILCKINKENLCADYA